jgi:diacylglycerol kinase (ATP)
MRIARAFIYSWQGLSHAVRHERAFCDELILFVVALPIAYLISATPGEFVLLMLSLLSVMIVELLNSAIETVVNLVSPQQHPLAGQAKDLGSAAVFLTLGGAAVVWGYVITTWALA